MQGSTSILAASSLASIITFIYPIFVTYRFIRNERDQAAPKKEKYIQYVTILTLTVFFLNEICKVARFGLERNLASKYDTARLVPMWAVETLVNILTETSHILLVTVVLARLLALVEVPRPILADGKAGTDTYTMTSIMVMVTRLIMPLLALMMKARVTAFGIYSFLVYILETGIFTGVTYFSAKYIKTVEKDYFLTIPVWRLFSNPIATSVMAFFSILTFIVAAASFDPKYEFSMVTQDNVSVLIMPSIYAIFVGLSLVMFQDTKMIIQEAKQVGGNPGSKRIKFDNPSSQF